MTLGVVVTGKVHNAQLASRRVDQPSQKDRKMLTRLDVPCRPFGDPSRRDRQEHWRVRADGDGPIFDASAIAVGRRLEVKQFRPVRTERSLQPQDHVLRQRRPTVQQIRQCGPADPQSPCSFGYRHPRRDDPLPNEATNFRGAFRWLGHEY